ncbi:MULTISPECIES: ChrR family anti-sigma-E factor [unclassified Brevundimonas]|uniref:cadmium/peroxide/UV radiation responsive anti-sigma factor ChrR n=1 Tax=unclassified Brevundimonas TaxID=2622653 RepID=UPI0025C58169|nr:MULTISPECIES: ChrR family anti-sigma-E factor [unclassified Brevundimonas]
MNTQHNVSEARMLAYAAGALSAPEAVVMATHLALRPQLKPWLNQLQKLGGIMLEDTPAEAMREDALATALSRIETDAGEAAQPLPLNDMPELPEPLRHYELGPWRWAGPGIKVRNVNAPRDGKCRVILLKIEPGQKTPRHTHGGVELTCVLSGAYATETERFDVGDLEEADHEVLHQPRVVSDEPCLCVVALDGEIQLDGWLGPILQPFVKL